MQHDSFAYKQDNHQKSEQNTSYITQWKQATNLDTSEHNELLRKLISDYGNKLKPEIKTGNRNS